mmetsp:Transcript_81265/g.161253  ORF Transcript_81265/g.161253 Transcript_81265/m.161253 type:complete len:595 (+) Transcript_81265:35-1819(+)
METVPLQKELTGDARDLACAVRWQGASGNPSVASVHTRWRSSWYSIAALILVGCLLGGCGALFWHSQLLAQGHPQDASNNAVSKMIVSKVAASAVLGADKVTTAKRMEWVVSNYNVKVRQSPSIQSRQLGTKPKGTIVLGKRRGLWLSLVQEIGWIRIKLGGTKLLEPRPVEYARVSKGSCGDSGRYAITSLGVCEAASVALGNGPGAVRLYTGDEARPQGCYIENGVLWMAINPNGVGDGGCRGPCNVGTLTRTLLCSSQAYHIPGTGFLTSGAIKSRMKALNQSVAKSFLRCKKPKKSCRVLWSKGIKDFVRYGFGSALTFFQPFRAYLAFTGCSLVVSEHLAKEWAQNGLAPFWNVESPMQEWMQEQPKAPTCPISFLKHWGPEAVRCEARRGAVSDEHRLAFWRSTYYNKSPFQGYTDLLLQTLGPRLSLAKQPFQARYAAFHVRRGDLIPAMYKQGKGHRLDGITVPLFTAILRARWPELNRIFVATDDEHQVAMAAKMGQENLIFNWTQERRWHGGAPVSQSKDHVHTDGDVTAVLDDMVALAGAAVLIGGSDSSFFNVARLLNLGLHMDSQRPYPWCYDAFLHKVCD